MSWRARMRQWAAERGRQAQRVAAQGYERARLAGRKLAVKVTAIQKAARLNAKLTAKSLQSVRQREHARAADAAWRDAYVQQATPRGSPQAQGIAESAEPAVSADLLLRQEAREVADKAGAGVLVASDHDSAYITPGTGGAERPGHDRGGMPPGAIPAGAVRPLSFEPSRRAGTDRLPPGHGRLISKGHFASAEEASRAADAWRSGASFAEYIAMGTGGRGDREAGQ